VARTRNRKPERPIGGQSPTVDASRLNRWPFVDRTQEAVEKGVAYIITGQHRRPREDRDKPGDRGDGDKKLKVTPVLRTEREQLLKMVDDYMTTCVAYREPRP
jgi:hypothetical protein